MGIVRLLLALTVLLSHYHIHSANGPNLSAPMPVQAFFVISKIMALVLDTKYSSNVSFWIRRLLSMDPVCLITALAALVLSCTGTLRWPGTYWGYRERHHHRAGVGAFSEHTRNASQRPLLVIESRADILLSGSIPFAAIAVAASMLTAA
jgi:peptidoglycan/LPS O-acetylase OafA/YrhL